jgi:hypothetical protein
VAPLAWSTCAAQRIRRTESYGLVGPLVSSSTGPTSAVTSSPSVETKDEVGPAERWVGPAHREKQRRQAEAGRLARRVRQRGTVWPVVWRPARGRTRVTRRLVCGGLGGDPHGTRGIIPVAGIEYSERFAAARGRVVGSDADPGLSRFITALPLPLSKSPVLHIIGMEIIFFYNIFLQVKQSNWTDKVQKSVLVSPLMRHEKCPSRSKFCFT